LDGAVWLALAVLVFFTIGRHEPWADEAQSWLLARDLPWFKLIFCELRYEGHPGLWHSILWIAIHWLHLPYGALGYVGGGFAVAGLAVLLFHALFPRPLRYLIASSFFFIYQYAVIARSYELLPLLAFGSACLFRKGIRHVIPFAVALSLMSHVSVHGATIAVALAIAFIARLRSQWSGLAANQKNQVLVAGAIFGFALVLLAVILFPPNATTVAMSDARTFTLEAHVMKTFFGLCAAVTDYLPLALLILLLVGIWFVERRGLFLMLSAVGGTALIYGFLRGTRHHQGLILIAGRYGLPRKNWHARRKHHHTCMPQWSLRFHCCLPGTRTGLPWRFGMIGAALTPERRMRPCFSSRFTPTARDATRTTSGWWVCSPISTTTFLPTWGDRMLPPFTTRRRILLARSPAGPPL
jgi:hypothetical protein